MPQTVKFMDEPECHFSTICSESNFNGKAFNRISSFPKWGFGNAIALRKLRFAAGEG